MSLPNIFGANIAQQLNAALGPQLLPLRLGKVTNVRDPMDPTQMVPTTVYYKGRGFSETTRVRDKDGQLTQTTMRVVAILGASLPSGIEPLPGDVVEIESQTLTIVDKGVTRDPAGALFQCEVQL